MRIKRNPPFRHLKIMTQSDQMRRAVRVVQKTIIESFSITDPVAGEIEGNARDDNQVRFIRLVINACRTGFKNTKRPFSQLLNPLNAAKHHLMAANRRIQNPFSRLKCSGQEQFCIGLIVSRGIQRYAVSFSILIKREQVELGSST